MQIPWVILRDCPVLYLCILWLGNIMTPVEGHINSLRSYPQWWVPGCERIYQLLSHLLESFRKKTGLLMDGFWWKMVRNQQNTIPQMLILSLKLSRTKCSILVGSCVLEDSNSLSRRSPYKTALPIIRFTTTSQPLRPEEVYTVARPRVLTIWQKNMVAMDSEIGVWIFVERLSSQKWNKIYINEW